MRQVGEDRLASGYGDARPGGEGCRLGALFGSGRSGTTWLGAIVNAHPRLAYRFEPFGRGRASPDLMHCKQRLEHCDFSDRDVPHLYRLLARATPFTEKPPFFDKEGTTTLGREWLWRVARVLPPVRPIFAARFTPRDGRMIVFKEVTAETLMAGMLKVTGVPVVYLVRSPFGTVASLMRGQAKGVMPTGRFEAIESLIEEHDPTILEQVDGSIDRLSSCEKNAVLWRIDIEKAVNGINTAGRGLLLTYEQLCTDPVRYSEEVFAELGLDMHPQIRRFIASLHEIEDESAKPPRSSDVRDPYFTVFRNPGRQKDRWKRELTRDEIHQIERIVQPSHAFQQLAQSGGW